MVRASDRRSVWQVKIKKETAAGVSACKSPAAAVLLSVYELSAATLVDCISCKRYNFFIS